MATTLGIDIGSSSVIAGILRGNKVLAEAPRAFFKSRCDGPKVEVDPDELLRALRTALAGLGGRAAEVDAALDLVEAAMAPCAADATADETGCDTGCGRCGTTPPAWADPAADPGFALPSAMDAATLARLTGQA